MVYTSKYHHDDHGHGDGGNNGGHEQGGQQHKHQDHEHSGQPCCDDCFIYINGMRFNIEKGLTISLKNTQIIFKHVHSGDDVKVEVIDHKGYTIKIERKDPKLFGNEQYPKLYINEVPIEFVYLEKEKKFAHHAFFIEFETLDKLAEFYIEQFPNLIIHSHGSK